MNIAPGIRAATPTEALLPSRRQGRIARPRHGATGTMKKEANRLTERREGESSDGVYIKRRRVTGTTDQPPPPATSARAQSHKGKAPINVVMHPLTRRNGLIFLW